MKNEPLSSETRDLITSISANVKPSLEVIRRLQSSVDALTKFRTTELIQATLTLSNVYNSSMSLYSLQSAALNSYTSNLSQLTTSLNSNISTSHVSESIKSLTNNLNDVYTTSFSKTIENIQLSIASLIAVIDMNNRYNQSNINKAVESMIDSYNLLREEDIAEFSPDIADELTLNAGLLTDYLIDQIHSNEENTDITGPVERITNIEKFGIFLAVISFLIPFLYQVSQDFNLIPNPSQEQLEQVIQSNTDELRRQNNILENDNNDSN